MLAAVCWGGAFWLGDKTKTAVKETRTHLKYIDKNNN